MWPRPRGFGIVIMPQTMVLLLHSCEALTWAGKVWLWLALLSPAALHLMVVAVSCSFPDVLPAWGLDSALLEEGPAWDSLWLGQRGQGDLSQQREQRNSSNHARISELGPSDFPLFMLTAHHPSLIIFCPFLSGFHAFVQAVSYLSLEHPFPCFLTELNLLIL